MSYLTATQIEGLIRRVQRACADGDTPEWRAVHYELHATGVRLWLPLGELLNPVIAGYVWAWRLRGAIGDPVPHWAGMPGVASQGLEPLVPIAGADLMSTALLALEIGPYRLVVRPELAPALSPEHQHRPR